MVSMEREATKALMRETILELIRGYESIKNRAEELVAMAEALGIKLGQLRSAIEDYWEEDDTCSGRS